MAYAEEKPKQISEDDKEELTEQFKSDLAESKAFMEPIQQRMDRDYETYRNYRSGINTDEIDFKVSDFFEYVETIVPIVTNNRIRASVKSDYPDYVTHAKGMNDILDNTYDLNNWDYMSQEILRMALINRSSFVYTGFDKKHKNGTGKLCIDKVNPRWCWIDPNPTDLEDSRFFFYAVPMRKTQVFKLYPGKKKEIQTSIQRNMPSQFDKNTNNGGSGGWFKTFIGTIKNYLVFNGTNQAKPVQQSNTVNAELSEQQKHKNVIAFIEYWYRDDEDEWRKSCWADDVLLTDEPNPFWHGCLPYDILSPVKDVYSALGVPMSEQIESMTQNRNAMMNYVLQNSKLHARPPMLWNSSYGNVKDPQKLKEMADEGVIPVNNPDFVPMNAIADYMNVPVLPGYATSIFDQLGNIKDQATGVNDSFRGTQQGTSGKEVQLQQEAAYTRIKTMIDQFELTNKKIAEKTIVNAMQFYTQNRGFRIRGDYRKYEFDQQQAEQTGKPMPFEIEKVQKGINNVPNPETGETEQQPVYDRTEFYMYANPNEWTKLDAEGDEDGEEQEQESTQEDGEARTKSDEAGNEQYEEEVEKAFKVIQMTVEIEAGSSLPQSRLARREEAMELYAAHAIDQEALLDAYDWPDRDEILKRMEENAQKAAEAQAQQAQAVEQAKAQTEQAKINGQMQIEQMKIQADAAKTQANNNAKLEQQHVSNRGQVAEQSAENSGGSLAEMVEQIRQSNPSAANLSDEEIIQALTGEQAQQQGGGLAEQLAQVRQQNPNAQDLSDDELIAALTGGGQ